LLPVGPFRLLVGRDIRELTAIRQVLRLSSFYGITLTLALALVGGLLLAISAERRLAEINRTTRQIMAGDLSRRAPLKGSDDEHDELAQNINTMLDQIENLLEGMRHVGDSVAHDLRGPITRLRNRLETVAAAAKPSREDLADCIAQLDQVLATFNALLRIARVESGAYRSAFTTVDLRPIVRDVCELYQAAAEERQVTLRGEALESVEVFGDRELLAQVLTNLVDNAVKYTPPGGIVRIELSRSGDLARLRVSDSGPGIPPEDRARVLQRFTRLDRARSQPGNGLGLALVNAVTLQHHGRLTLDNGPGLVVTVELPALSLPLALPSAAAR
jgi:signal transduction histidine kinase